MSKGAVAKANANMAAYMKAKRIVRTTCNCPICHHRISLAGLENHIRTCQG